MAEVAAAGSGFELGFAQIQRGNDAVRGQVLALYHVLLAIYRDRGFQRFGLADGVG